MVRADYGAKSLCTFFFIDIFGHLELEIAFSIPASNDEK